MLWCRLIAQSDSRNLLLRSILLELPLHPTAGDVRQNKNKDDEIYKITWWHHKKDAFYTNVCIEEEYFDQSLSLNQLHLLPPHTARLSCNKR